MPEEYEIQAVMANTDCDRETAIKALQETNRRVGFAIRRVIAWLHTEYPSCVSCGEPMSGNWKFCPRCGEPLKGC